MLDLIRLANAERAEREAATQPDADAATDEAE